VYRRDGVRGNGYRAGFEGVYVRNNAVLVNRRDCYASICPCGYLRDGVDYRGAGEVDDALDFDRVESRAGDLDQQFGGFGGFLRRRSLGEFGSGSVNAPVDRDRPVPRRRRRC